jgi:hypothetical protein
LKENYHVKEYFHLYDQDTISNKRSNENGVIARSNYDFVRRCTGILEVPNDASILDYFIECKKFGDSWSDDYKSLKNLLMQLYSISKSLTLTDAYDPDVVIFLRPDILYLDKINFRVINDLIENPEKIYIPGWQWWGGYNDRFAFCGKSSFKIYGSRLLNVVNYCREKEKPLHGERLVKYVIKKNNIPVGIADVRAVRVRVDGSRKKEIFSSVRGMGGLSSVVERMKYKIN